MKQGNSGEKLEQNKQKKGQRVSSTIQLDSSKATLAEIAKSKGIAIESLRKVEFVDVNPPEGCEEVTIPNEFIGDQNPGLTKEQVTKRHKQLVKDFEKLLREPDQEKSSADKKSKSDSSNISSGSEGSLPSAGKIAKQFERKEEAPKKPPKMKKGRFSFFN